MMLLIPRVGIMELVRTARPGIHLWRGLLLAVSTLCLIGAISFVPLADAYTITFAAPLLFAVSPLARRARRLAALERRARGLCRRADRDPPRLRRDARRAPPCRDPALGFALYQILTRKVGAVPGESPLAMLFYLACVGPRSRLTAPLPSSGRRSRPSAGGEPPWARSAGSAICS